MKVQEYVVTVTVTLTLDVQAEGLTTANAIFDALCTVDENLAFTWLGGPLKEHKITSNVVSMREV